MIKTRFGRGGISFGSIDTEHLSLFGAPQFRLMVHTIDIVPDEFGLVCNIRKWERESK